MNLPLFIARRYLFARKSHNVINIISAISSAGMAVGTAALIIILSVYNGFDALVKSMLSTTVADYVIVPSQGKFFVPDGPVYDWMYDDARIGSVCTVLQDNAFVSYDGRQGTSLVKGVDEIYEEETPLADGSFCNGEFRLRLGERRYAAVGAGLARSLGLSHHFRAGLDMYYPNTAVRFSVVNPLASLNSETVWPSCEFSVNPDMDNTVIMVSRDVAQSLFGRSDDEVSMVEIRLASELGAREQRQLRREIESRLGPEYRLLDRTQQNPEVYKMLRYEKASVYFIMIFVVLILGFSIFGSLTMLIIEKKDDIATLRAMGADKSLIRRTFVLEGWLITVLGMAAGMVIGIAFCLLQQHFGFIPMPGNFVVDAYPVHLMWQDVLLSSVSIALMGYLIALVPGRR